MNKQDSHTNPSFSLINRMQRALWNTVWFFFFRPTLPCMHSWRRFLLCLFGACIGKDCHIYPGARIWAPWNLVCEDTVCIANSTTIYNQAPIKIGARSIVSQGVYLCTGTHDYTDKNFPLLACPITIGHDVWIAAEVFVHPGVTIGPGAVIGARSVVTKDIPAWKVCTGNPCRIYKDRIMRT